MFYLPKFSKIKTAQALDVYASLYTQCSGFKVNRDYYENNQVFAIHWKSRMVGGFVLGTGDTLRTLEVFVGSEYREEMYQQVKASVQHTEMCCFWMDPSTRKKTWLNFFVWFCVGYALWVYGTQQLIFGTNSVRLAALYGASPKCELIHKDFLHQKQTFVFTGPRKHCLLGVFHILRYKFKRVIKIAGKRNKSERSHSKQGTRDFRIRHEFQS